MLEVVNCSIETPVSVICLPSAVIVTLDPAQARISDAAEMKD
jgi:hypothetical protein